MSAPTGVLAGDGMVSGVVMAAMAMGSVGLWTLRVTFAARGRKVLGAAVAAVEAVVFAMAFSNLTASLDAPVRVIGYALGVAIGTVLGLSLDERASRGRLDMQRSSMEPAGLVERLGPPSRRPVMVTFLGVDNADVPHLVDAIQRSVPEAFWVVHQRPASAPARSASVDARRCGRRLRRCGGEPDPLISINWNREDSR